MQGESSALQATALGAGLGAETILSAFGCASAAELAAWFDAASPSERAGAVALVEALSMSGSGGAS